MSLKAYKSGNNYYIGTSIVPAGICQLKVDTVSGSDYVTVVNLNNGAMLIPRTLVKTLQTSAGVGYASLAAFITAMDGFFNNASGSSDATLAALLASNPILLQGNYSTPKDGTATYTSNVTITMAISAFIVSDANCFIVGIIYKPAAGLWTKLINGHNGVSITASANVVTVAGAGTPFAVGDTYRVVIDYQQKAYNTVLNANNSNVVNPDRLAIVDPVALVDTTNIAATTTYYPDTSGILLDGYKNVCIEGVTSGNVTTTIEATIDPAASPDWIDITKAAYDLLTNTTGNASFVDVSFLLDFDNLNVKYLRVKSVTGDNTNAVQYSYRLTA